jgi:hypothetical protein
MKKKLFIITSLLISAAVLSLSSCLKDNRYVDFSNTGTIVNFNLGGLAYFSQDAITETPDSDANGTIVRQFAVNIGSSTPPKTATVITLAVDSSLVAPYNAANTAVQYTTVPSNAYVFTNTTVTIPAGQTTAIVSITFYKNKLNSATSYMLPVRIAKAPYTISANMGIHYFHFIGNVFAGAYTHYYSRWETPDTTTTPSSNRVLIGTIGSTTLSPVTPNEFTVQTNYYTQPNYDVTFTITGTGATATYSNFAVKFLPGDIAAGSQWAENITVATSPKLTLPNYDPTIQYTYAQALKLFRFYFNTSSRAIIDEYDK